MHANASASDRSRKGKVLVAFVLVMPVLVGLAGLVVDGGMLHLRSRAAQNAADAAALAGAHVLSRGGDPGQAIATARDWVLRQEGFGAAGDEGLAVHCPPAEGPYASGGAGSDPPRYVEVVVRRPVRASLITILGLAGEREIQARAVAGHEAAGLVEGLVTLDPRTDVSGGLVLSEGATLGVNGGIVVNSRGRGRDEYGLPVPPETGPFGVETGSDGRIVTDLLDVVGGVDQPGHVLRASDSPAPAWSGPAPVRARRCPAADPFRDLAIPRAAAFGTVKDSAGSLVSPRTGTTAAYAAGDGAEWTFSPGVYSDISVTGSADVTFRPGIYVLVPEAPGDGLRIGGRGTVSGSDVLFYLAGSDYLEDLKQPDWAHAGRFDVADGRVEGPALDLGPPLPAPDPASAAVHYAGLDLAPIGGTVSFRGLAEDSTGLEMLFFFRRRAGGDVGRISALSGGTIALSGTIYAKWGRLVLAGPAGWDVQLVAGRVQVIGAGPLTLRGHGQDHGLIRRVFLVE